MPAKRYQLQEAAASPFCRGGVYQFRVGYVRTEGALKRYIPAVRGQVPTFSVNCPNTPAAAVIETSNEHAQQCLENMRSPDRTVRNGSRRGNDPLWIDVTDSIPTADLVLDPSFP